MPSLWSTIDEITYIKSIIKNNDKLIATKKLMNYNKSIDLREDWGNLDKEKIKQTVEDCLKEIKQ